MITRVESSARTSEMLQVLLVEDNHADARLVTEYLHEAQPRRFEVTHAPRLSHAFDRLREQGFSAIVLDLGLPDSQGLDTLARARAKAPQSPIIVLSGLDDEHLAIDAVFHGAQDYLVKGALTGWLLRHSLVYAIERARFEEATHAKDERFQQLTENMREVFFVIDSQFRETVYISPGYSTVWGRSCESLYISPASFLDAVLPEDVAIVRDHFAAAQAGENAGEVEFRIVRPNSELRWILSSATPVRNARGEVYRIAGVAMDVTDRHGVIDALQESETRYRLLSETSYDGIALSENGIIIEANSGFVAMFGYETSEVPGMRMLDLVADESLEECGRRIALEIEGKYDVVGRHRDGHTMRLEATARTHSAQFRRRRITAFHDVTQRLLLERQFREAQKMEAIGRLAGGVAHDFNNLLTVITGYTDMAIAADAMPGSIRSDLEQVRKAADSAAALTRQLLTFSRRQMIVPKPLDLNEVVRDAERMLRRVIGEDVTLETGLAADLGLVQGDFGQMQQVIMNLVINARDAMPDGGVLSIRTANASFLEDTPLERFVAKAGAYVTLSIGDTGSGMNEQTKAQIFEPFFTTKEAGRGTGLGLSIVYGIVTQNGGGVAVHSELGAGTVFTIYLPRTEPSRSAAAPAAAWVPTKGTETVLLVEDVAEVREVLGRILTGLGYTVLDASDSTTAIERASVHDGPIHLLLTDVVLPSLSGRELAQLLAPLRPEMKVLYTSGYTDDAVVRHGAFDHEIAFLQKPFTPEALARRVREVLG